MLLLSYKNYEILCWLSGERNLEKPTCWFNNNISILKADTVYMHTSGLSNLECAQGYLSGY